jgi:hypothetical protein
MQQRSASDLEFIAVYLYVNILNKHKNELRLLLRSVVLKMFIFLAYKGRVSGYLLHQAYLKKRRKYF